MWSMVLDIKPGAIRTLLVKRSGLGSSDFLGV